MRTSCYMCIYLSLITTIIANTIFIIVIIATTTTTTTIATTTTNTDTNYARTTTRFVVVCGCGHRGACGGCINELAQAMLCPLCDQVVQVVMLGRQYPPALTSTL